MNKKNKSNKGDKRLIRKQNRLQRLLPAMLINKPQIYGMGSTVATFEMGYITDGNDRSELLYGIISSNQQVPGAYFTQYKYFKIISVVVTASPSSAPGVLSSNLVWAGQNWPDINHDDTTRRIPISTNRITYAVFVPPKVIVSHAALATNFVTNLGGYTCTNDHLVNGVPIIPGVVATAGPANVNVTVYVKIEFKGQKTEYYDKP